MKNELELGLDFGSFGAGEMASQKVDRRRLAGDGHGLMLRADDTGLWKARGQANFEPDAVEAALKRDATAQRVLRKRIAPGIGDMVGVRLNLNILRSQGVCVHSIHRGGSVASLQRGRGFWNGEVLDYRPMVTLRNAWFSVHQPGREAIASGRQAKHPMASIDGELVVANESADGVEVRFNPKVTHLFVDGDGYGLRWAEEVTIVGHRAYARGVLVYHDEHTAPKRGRASAPSLARVRGQ